MRKFIALVALSTSLPVLANPVLVEGVGITRYNAREDAFKVASEKYCGTVLLSERHTRNENIKRNDITAYSSCRVKSYKIVAEDFTNNNYSIRLEVVLEPSNHSKRVTANNKSYNVFDQSQVSAELETYQYEKAQGDRLLKTTFSDYPYNAYHVDLPKQPYVMEDNYRNFYLVVPYKVTWNYDYIQAMRDTISVMSDNKGPGYVRIIAKDPNALLLGRQNYYYMNDLKRIDQIKNYMSGPNEMRLKLQVSNTQGNRIINVCYNPEYKAGGIFYSVGVNRQVTIFGNDVNKGEMKIKLTFPADVIYDVYVDVVPQRDCKL